jgi:hypothetical protein
MRRPEMRTGFIIPSETHRLTEDNPNVKADQVHRSGSLMRKWTNYSLPRIVSRQSP